MNATFETGFAAGAVPALTPVVMNTSSETRPVEASTGTGLDSHADQQDASFGAMQYMLRLVKASADSFANILEESERRATERQRQRELEARDAVTTALGEEDDSTVADNSADVEQLSGAESGAEVASDTGVSAVESPAGESVTFAPSGISSGTQPTEANAPGAPTDALAMDVHVVDTYA